MKYDIIVLGSGPGGYVTAIRASQLGFKVAIIEKESLGGICLNWGCIPTKALLKSAQVLEYLKHASDYGLTVKEFDKDFSAVIARSRSVADGMSKGVQFLMKKNKIDVIDGFGVLKAGKKVSVTNKDNQVTEYSADYIIIATGASAKWLGIESEQKFNGFGVSACAVCDGFFYRGQDVAIVGGGDTAAEEASYLAKLCKKVYMIVRKDELKASKAMQHRVFNTPNIEVLFNTETLEITGEQTVSGARFKNNSTNEEFNLDITGFFVAIGHTPNSSIFKDWLEMDENGYIKTIPGSSKTNIQGVFACGDVQDHIYRQAVTAAGSGCMAALDAERYLATVGIEA
jgi:thioredoxin reductase